MRLIFARYAPRSAGMQSREKGGAGRSYILSRSSPNAALGLPFGSLEAIPLMQLEGTALLSAQHHHSVPQAPMAPVTDTAGELPAGKKETVGLHRETGGLVNAEW